MGMAGVEDEVREEDDGLADGDPVRPGDILDAEGAEKVNAAQGRSWLQDSGARDEDGFLDGKDEASILGARIEKGAGLGGSGIEEAKELRPGGWGAAHARDLHWQI